jgi:hypothetical protein
MRNMPPLLLPWDQRHHHGLARREHGQRVVRADQRAVADPGGAAVADAGPLPRGIRVAAGPADLGLAGRTLEAYARGLVDYLTVCAHEGIDPVTADRAEIARYVRDLTRRPNPRGGTIVAIDSGVGLANATLQQRLVVVRLFYDHLIEEGRRDTNPVGRGRYTPGGALAGTGSAD